MEKTFIIIDNSILTNITHINDLYLNLISYLSIKHVLALSQVSKYYNGVCNEVYIWKQMLRQDFNWPPKRRSKGSKKQQKNKTEMTAAGLKLIYIQKHKEMQPKDDSDLFDLIQPLYAKHYLNAFGDNLQIPYCDHRRLRFVPEEARKPLYFGCEKCRSRVELNAGLTKGQMRELFAVKKHYSQYQLWHALCGPDVQMYHVADLEQLRP